MTDELDLDAIEARANAAAAGPWRWTPSTTYKTAKWELAGSDRPVVYAAVADVFPSVSDAEFIEHAREDVPALVAELRTTRAERVHWRDAWHELAEEANNKRVDFTSKRDALAARIEALERSRNSARLSIKRVLAYEIHLSGEGARSQRVQQDILQSLIGADSALSGATELATDRSES